MITSFPAWLQHPGKARQFSCKKDVSQNTNHSSFPNSNTAREALSLNQIGEIHNLGLNNLLETNDIITKTTQVNFVSSITGRLFSFLYELDVEYFDSEDSLLNATILNDAIDDGFLFDCDEAWTFVNNDLSEELGGDLTSTELNYINSVKSIIDYAIQNYEGKVNEQIDYVQGQLSNLIADYEMETWGEGQGTLAGGMLYVAKASADYWEQQTNNPDVTTAKCIQFDAAGPIFTIGLITQTIGFMQD